MFSSPSNKAVYNMSAASELRQLAQNYEKMGEQVIQKANQLFERDKLLQIEFAERKKIEVDILALTQAEQKLFGDQHLSIAHDLRKLAYDYEKMGKLVIAKTNELIESEKLLQAEISERKKSAAEVLEISQAEQRRFGSQLHDGLCQELAAILIFAKSLAKKMEKNKNLDLDELHKISEMLLSAVDEARNTARGLYPGDLDGSSLMLSIEELVSRTTEVHCTFICPTPILMEDTNTATHLYRMVQEGISNAIKHGKAKNIEVSLTVNENYITLQIKDDGIGVLTDLKTSDFSDSKGIGLKIMKNRAHMMNATFQVRANSPRGIILECSLKQPKAQKRVL